MFICLAYYACSKYDCNQYCPPTNPLHTTIAVFFVLTSAAPPLLTPLYYCFLCVALCCLLGTNYNGQWSIDTWATVFEFQLAPGT